MPGQDTILLQTKLHRPRLPKDLLPRVQLIEQLNRDLDRQLVLVCGPAGFGKTTLIGTWLDQLATVQNDTAATPRSAWLSLDERDSDLTLFLRYAIAALRTAFEDCCEHTLSLLQARQQPPRPCCMRPSEMNSNTFPVTSSSFWMTSTRSTAPRCTGCSTSSSATGQDRCIWF